MTAHSKWVHEKLSNIDRKSNCYCHIIWLHSNTRVKHCNSLGIEILSAHSITPSFIRIFQSVLQVSSSHWFSASMTLLKNVSTHKAFKVKQRLKRATCSIGGCSKWSKKPWWCCTYLQLCRDAAWRNSGWLGFLLDKSSKTWLIYWFIFIHKNSLR